MCRLLVISTLYPNRVHQRHGIFVETRLRQLMSASDLDATVIAPVPWFPINSKLFPEYAKYAAVPREERRHGVDIYHPRYLVIPKVGMLLTPLFLAISIAIAVMKLRRSGLAYDLVDAHYYYPDGVAVALIAKLLGTPFLVTARGTDINLIPDYAIPRRLILWAADRAAVSFTVCSALKQRMVELGADADKIHVMRNGVDLEFFRPLDRELCRKRYELSRTTLVSVGHLIERKGHHLAIEALGYMPEVDLLIAGDGEEESNLRALADRQGVADRVTFLGAVSQGELVEIYNAADILLLASSREGWANVLLEAMACGTPVVATNIWGTPEVVASPEAGVLVAERTAAGLADGVNRLLADYPSRGATRNYAEGFSWGDTVSGITKILANLVELERRTQQVGCNE